MGPGMNYKSIALKNFDETINFLQRTDCMFCNFDFRDVLNKMCLSGKNRDSIFIYADPPYLSTEDNYAYSFAIEDANDLFNLLANSGIKFAMSEQENPEINELIKQYDLHKFVLKEKYNIKKFKTEILITNYSPQQTLFRQEKLN
jgi:site-specific DNA-adenine methylase